MVKIYKPKLEDMWFRQELLADSDTMSYNHAYGGTIDFPKEYWNDWYNDWVNNDDVDYYYRYVVNENDEFVGEIAYHLDKEYNAYIADVIIFSKYRRRGYGKEALKLLCKAAKENGIKCIYDNIVLDNKAIKMFLDYGFYEEYRNDEFIMLKKDL